MATSFKAEKEKRWAAESSVLAAAGLTLLKVIVGLITGSLGILAEAAHSGLDLIAALITLMAVRFSDKPADKSHPYGHGKVENISALFETLLLLLTCAWILREAVMRLFFRPVHVDPSVWAFLVMMVSIVVDISRSRMLYRAARKHNSQALEADALHFSTDIWSSLVVIIGLIGVFLAHQYPKLTFLDKADPVSALGVAVIVVIISVRLGVRTVQALVDFAPIGLAEQIKQAAEALPDVTECHNIRLRYSGPHLFVDVHILMDGNQTLKQAHDLTEKVEAAIQQVAAGADVTVHPEPVFTEP